jgi:hypothetical protein
MVGTLKTGGPTGSGGDPYVFSINSKTPVKLPNKEACYRMFEQGNNYVNVEVGRASKEHQMRMLKYASEITPVTHNVTCDGFFYTKAFISAEGHKVMIDYQKKTIDVSSDSVNFFKMSKSKKLFNCGEFRETCMCCSLQWETKENKTIRTEIMFFPNPHVENGINVIPETVKKSVGMIVENYRPKLMQLKNVVTEKYGKLWRRLEKTDSKFQKKNIKGKHEVWVK